MKLRISITLFIFAAICSYAQTSNLVVNIIPPRQEFLAGQASYSDTTNSNIGFIDGYYCPSNFAGVTRWQFPSRIITSTNYVLALRILSTNTDTVLAGSYRVQVYTNNGANPFYDSSEQIYLGTPASNNTNIESIFITNNLPLNVVTNRSLITYGSVYFRIGPTVGNWYTAWLNGGYIQFQ